MMTIAAMGGAAAAEYYGLEKSGSKQDEYYSEGGKSVGKWVGGGAAALGFSGEINAHDFKKAAAGYDAWGNKCVQNAGAEGRASGWDLTLSAPKSISVAWALADKKGRQEIEEMLENAAMKAYQFVEDNAAVSRKGKGGAEKTSAKLVMSVFRHETSRAGDPQLHFHGYVHNVALREDGTTGTLESKHFYTAQKLAGAYFVSEAAQGMRDLGYVVNREENTIRLDAVSRGMEMEFSTRSGQIDEYVKETGNTSAQGRDLANLATRQEKDEDAIPEALDADWELRAAKHGLTTEILAKHREENKESALEFERSDGHRVMEMVTRTTAVASEKDLVYAALVLSMEGGGAAEYERLLAEAKAMAVELRDEKGNVFYTTQEIIDAEKSVQKFAAESNPDFKFEADAEAAIQSVQEKNGFTLADEQAQAVRWLCDSRAAAVLVGDAGTGKSTTMQAVREAYEAKGIRVIGVAPTQKAANELQSSAGIQSRTIDSLNYAISNAEKKPLDENTLVVVDEAGMCNALQMQKLTEAAKEAGAKIIFVGDHKQLQPVGAGAPFRALEKELGSARLEHIRRQRDEGDKTAVKQLSEGEAYKALAHYAGKGLVTVSQTHNKAMHVIANKIIDGIDKHGAKETLGLASTNDAVEQINVAVRERLKAKGELADNKDYTALREGRAGRFDRKGSEKNHAVTMNIAVNDRVVYSGRNYKKEDLARSDMGTVIALNKDTVTVKMDNGKTLEICPEKRELRHAYAITTHKAQGATVEYAVIYAQTQHNSRQMSYVQASRARGETEIVTSQHQIKALAERTEISEAARQRIYDIESERLSKGRDPVLDKDIQNLAQAMDYLKRADRVDKITVKPGDIATNREVNFVKRIEESRLKKGQEPKLDESKIATVGDVKDYLKSINYDPKLARSRDAVESFEALAEAMSESKEAQSTLDYKESMPELQLDQAAEFN